MTQLTLIETETEADKRFHQFHQDNPKVYVELVKLARLAKQRGRRKIGMKMLWEILRWNSLMDTTDVHYKLPNNHHSRYARLIQDQEPDLANIFETRELRS